jgi:hypothetical protein
MLANGVGKLVALEPTQSRILPKLTESILSQKAGKFYRERNRDIKSYLSHVDLT